MRSIPVSYTHLDVYKRQGQTTSEYITNLIQDYYNMIENQKGGIQMTEKGRTMAFQIPEELFQRIKRHLERETLRSGKKMCIRDSWMPASESWTLTSSDSSSFHRAYWAGA